MAIHVNESGSVKQLGGGRIEWIAYRPTNQEVSGYYGFGTDEYPSSFFKTLKLGAAIPAETWVTGTLTLPFAPRLLIVEWAGYANAYPMDNICLKQGDQVYADTGTSLQKNGRFFTSSTCGYGLQLSGDTLTVKYHSGRSESKNVYFLHQIQLTKK